MYYFKFTAWNAPNGEPDGGDGPHCLMDETRNPRILLWYDEACDKEYNAVCEVQVGKYTSKLLCQVTGYLLQLVCSVAERYFISHISGMITHIMPYMKSKYTCRKS